MLKGKKIILGITGSIAAYKSAMLVRFLIKEGAEVRTIMTKGACQFITPLTFSTLTKSDVVSDLTTDNYWNNHVEWGLWADIFLIAPATANTIAKLATGICDNFLTAVYLSARCPTIVSPAMDLDMYIHSSTQRNFNTLLSDGVKIIEATDGELASGLVGKGRMEEPENIVKYLNSFFKTKNTILTGKKVLITAGPTQESIDPVRYISNHSTGKMGYAIANAFSDYGAKVTLVTGKVNIPKPNVNEIREVVNAQEMFEAVDVDYHKYDIIVFSAAVADYTPTTFSVSKVKKSDGDMIIPLKRTVDIAATIGLKKLKNQLLVGFAMETDNPLQNAKGKLTRKSLDIVVLNSINDKGAGFGHDTNVVTIIEENKEIAYPLLKKTEVAEKIISHIIQKIENR